MVRIKQLPTFAGETLQAYRLVNSKFPPIAMFDDVADADEFEVLYEIQALTNPRLKNEVVQLELIARSEIPFGIAGCSYATAPFTHVNPAGSRFSDGSFGVLYLADTVDTYFTQNTLRYTGNTFEIGRRILPDLTTGQHFWGVIDELQIWHVSHSAEWIRMLYLNQNPLSPWPAGNAPATASPSES